MRLRILLVLVLCSPAPVLACSAGPCTSGYVVPEQATLPANHAALLWVSQLSWSRPKKVTAAELAKIARKVRLRRSDSKALVPVVLTPHESLAYSYWVKPSEGFLPGVEYVLDAPNECDNAGKKSTLHASLKISDAIPTPLELGKLVAAAPMRGEIGVATADGSCATQINASYVDVSVTPAVTAQPLAALFQYSTFVDGQPWKPTAAIYEVARPDRSWVGPGRDRVFTQCPSDKPEFGKPAFSVPAGKHRVEMRAQLPGSTTPLSTGTLEIDLRCAP